MLARNWDESIDPVGMWMSVKYDGMRAIWTGNRLVSRNNKHIHAPEWWTASLPKHLILDGELFMGNGKFQQTLSITRKQIVTPESDKEWEKIAYMVFDVIDTDQPWIKRYATLEIKHPLIPVPHFYCHTREQMDKFYATILEEGGEGIMLRKEDSSYIFGRSPHLLKVKPEVQGKAILDRVQIGEGKYSNVMGALICNDQTSGKEFGIGTGFSDEERQLDNWVVGMTIYYKYQCLTNDGIPRFPVYVRQ